MKINCTIYNVTQIIYFILGISLCKFELVESCLFCWSLSQTRDNYTSCIKKNEEDNVEEIRVVMMMMMIMLK